MRAASLLVSRHVAHLLRACGHVCHYSPGLRLVVLCGLLSVILASCAAPPPPVPPSPSQPRLSPPPTSTLAAEQQTAYAAAQAIRTRGAHAQALRAFVEFVQRYPTSPLADDALLAIGQIATGLGNYQQAQGAYTSLLTNFPTSEHRPTAHLELGILQYNMQDYEQSQETLRRYLTLPSIPARQALAHYYLGLMARQQQRYAVAIAELKLSVENSTDELLTEQARAEIEEIVRQYLSDEDLEQLAYQYSTVYPGDLLLLQRALHYQEAGNVDDEIETLQRFTTHFPAHPRFQEIAERLHTLQTAGTAVEPSKIGVLLPLSGDGSYFGQRALQGIELALATLQADDPTLQVSLVVRDSQGDSLVASEALRTLTNNEHVIGVIGPLFSQEAIDLTAVADQLGMPFLTPYAPEGEFPAASPYAFRNSLTDTLQGRFLAEYAVRGLQLHRFAILHADDPYGHSLKDAFMTQVRQLGGEVVAVAAYAPDATEFSRPIKAVGGVDDETLQDLRAGANVSTTETAVMAMPAPIYDAIFIPGYYDKVALIAPALAFYNISGVQLLGSDGWNAEEILAIGDRSVEGAVFVDGFFADSPAPVVQEFVEKFRLHYAKTPDLLAAQAYDSLFILAQALKEGATTRDELREALLRVHDFPGVSGTTSFHDDGNAAKIPFLLAIQNGRIVQLN